ncbi:hypothetical protein ACMFMF_000080 [Clarireedia jacksonii]
MESTPNSLKSWFIKPIEAEAPPAVPTPSPGKRVRFQMSANKMKNTPSSLRWLFIPPNAMFAVGGTRVFSSAALFATSNPMKHTLSSLKSWFIKPTEAEAPRALPTPSPAKRVRFQLPSNDGWANPADGVHTEFAQVVVHTAKCDVCGRRNTSVLQRCTICNKQSDENTH